MPVWQAILFGALTAVMIMWTFPNTVIPEQLQRKPRQNLQLGRELLDGAGIFQLNSLQTLDQKAAALLTTTGVLLGFGLLILEQVRTTIASLALYCGLLML